MCASLAVTIGPFGTVFSCLLSFPFPGRSIVNKKGDGSQVKESTDSSNTTLEDEDTKGETDDSRASMFISIVRLSVTQNTCCSAAKWFLFVLIFFTLFISFVSHFLFLSFLLFCLLSHSLSL